MPTRELIPTLEQLSDLSEDLPRMKALLATSQLGSDNDNVLSNLLHHHASALVAIAEVSLSATSRQVDKGDVTILAFQPLGEAYQTVGRLFRGDAIVGAGDLHPGGYAWESDAMPISVERVYALLGAGIVKANPLTERPGVRYTIDERQI